MRFFFYGTLMDADVRALVLGRAIPADAIGPATILGFRRVYVADRSYPMLTPERLGRIDGLLAHGLDGAAKARIGHFEGDEYRFEARTVCLAGGASSDALVAMARKGVVPSPRSWGLVPWQRRHKRVFLRALSGRECGRGARALPKAPKAGSHHSKGRMAEGRSVRGRRSWA